MTIRHWCWLAFCAGLFALALCNPVWALPRDLPYPIPQEKPCQVYWDSAAPHRLARHHPAVVAHLADKHMVIALLKDGTGIMDTHTAKGCRVLHRLSKAQVQDWLGWMRKGWDA